MAKRFLTVHQAALASQEMHPFHIPPSLSWDLSGESLSCLLLAFTWTPSFSSTLAVAHSGDVFWSCWGWKWPSSATAHSGHAGTAWRPGISLSVSWPHQVSCDVSHVKFRILSLATTAGTSLMPCPLSPAGAFLKQFFLAFTCSSIAVPLSPALAQVQMGLIDGHHAQNHGSEAGPLILSQTVWINSSSPSSFFLFCFVFKYCLLNV